MQLKPSIPEGVAPPLLSPSPGTPLDIVYAGHKHFSHLVLLPEIPTPTLLLFFFLWKKKYLLFQAQFIYQAPLKPFLIPPKQKNSFLFCDCLNI
jgi:hypothetical protein